MSGAKQLGVSIVAAGMTSFGERFDMSYEDLLADAYRACLESAGKSFDPEQIEAAWLGTGLGSLIRREPVTGASAADPLNLFPRPITHVENACATGSDAIRNAAFSIAAGVYDVVLVIGVEKMRDVPVRGSMIAQRGNLSHLWWHPRGATAPYLFAQHATVHAEQYGLTREHMAKVAVKNRANGTLNPKAAIRREIEVDDVIDAPMICSPLGLLDCCPTTDGAAAIILTRDDIAERYTDAPVDLIGLGLATDTMYSHLKPSFTEQPGPTAAGRAAYEMAGIGPEDIDVAELHDCFSVAEILAYEDLGFCARGEGPRWLDEGGPVLGGELPCNPSGGLLSKGHPIGATGIAQMSEIFWQVRGEAGERQVPGARIGLTHNVGGNAQVCAVNIARRR